MKSIHEIEEAVRQLPPMKLAEFRDWFAEFDARQWDEQLQRDAANGTLDRLAAQDLMDFENGKCRPL